MADNTLVALHPLTSDDKSYLHSLFELQLIIRTSDDEEDAVDILDYACDMVGRGKNVGSVVEEVSLYLHINVKDRFCLLLKICIDLSPCISGESSQLFAICNTLDLLRKNAADVCCLCSLCVKQCFVLMKIWMHK